MEIAALNYFKEAFTVDNKGIYEVHLPWVADHIILNSNEDICKERLKSTTKKLIQKKEFDDYETGRKEPMLMDRRWSHSRYAYQ
ncbi:hypothetical protein NPIL_551941 [Nephila pilipes]|uniref:Uncharacterized protein n=1 Tax=Nephila pilipes TaxID=299642 RepID=A0A8X6TA67_NEPPI|nr:hypothetical protein NPIL_551941 [Nephila pilipes]